MFHPLGIREKRFGGPGICEGERTRREGWNEARRRIRGVRETNKLTPARENGILGLNVTGTKAPTEAMERGD